MRNTVPGIENLPLMMHDEGKARVDLAAAFRWAARLNLHEGIANHFSLALSRDGKRFLLNPRGRHFSRIRASELLLLDADDADALSGENPPDPTAWYLHAQLHQLFPQARCILHTHMPNATTLCCLQDFEFLMLDQNACRFHERIAYDRSFNGMALSYDEGERIAHLLGQEIPMAKVKERLLVHFAAVFHTDIAIGTDNPIKGHYEQKTPTVV